MAMSLETSTLMKHGRIEGDIAEKNIAIITDALSNKDFPSFAKVVMQESN